MYTRNFEDPAARLQRLEDERKAQAQRAVDKVAQVAEELKNRTGEPWCHAPGVNQGLTVDCGSKQIRFIGTTAIRDKGRHNLELLVFNDLEGKHETVKTFVQLPQIKLTKSAQAIVNQLERSGVLELIDDDLKRTRNKNAQRRRDIEAANAAIAYLTRDFDLKTEPARLWTEAKLQGYLGQVSVKAETLHRKTGLVVMSFSDLDLKTARKLLEVVALAQAERDQADIWEAE